MGKVNLSDGNKCPICGKLGAEINSNGEKAPFFHYRCADCGCFFVPDPYRSYPETKLEDIYNIEHLKSYIFYHKTKLRPIICDKVYFNKNVDDKFIETYNLTPEMVESWYPKNFAEKIDLILLYLGQISAYDGDYLDLFVLPDEFFFVSSNKSQLIFDKASKNIQINFLVDYMEKQDYLMHMGGDTFQLSHKALEKIYELQKNQTNNNNVFVAMSFDDGTKELREKIKEGLKKFNVRIMDEIEHNHQIVPEMLYEIRNSRFVVAELSHHNNGAYYEAGYALGLGKEVIHICKKKEKENKLHFDVAQVNTIFYDSIDEIPEKLSKRIEATIK